MKRTTKEEAERQQQLIWRSQAMSYAIARIDAVDASLNTVETIQSANKIYDFIVNGIVPE